MFRRTILVFSLALLPVAAYAATNELDTEIKTAVDKYWQGEATSDANAISSNFAKDAIRVTPYGILVGFDAIKKDFDENAKDFSAKKWTIDVVTVLDPHTAAAAGTYAGVLSYPLILSRRERA